MLRILILIVISVLGGNGFSTFQTLIPNGSRVPNPCHTVDLWPGVGHKLVGGTGERNAFGIDFYMNNKTWTKSLCEKDSDGDGIKNGVELGDPDCTWTPNSTPKSSSQLSHPGVCEPPASEKCKEQNSWLTCPKKFSCPDFEKNSTNSIDLFLPTTAVPAQETTYMCHGFKMPNNTKYHAIGLVPHIDNKEIMHHMLLFGCSQPPKEKYLKGSVECLMSIEGCQTIIGLWSVGIDGECHPDQFGFPIGASGYQYTMVQVHWNNPLLRTGMTDASGVTLYYTDKLRPNDAVVIMAGQQYLEIPPTRETVALSGECTAACTKYLEPNKVNISAALLHMHLLGKSGSIELLRDGVVQKVLVDQTSYDYNTPIVVNYDPPVEFRAGDRIRINCVYQSLKNNKTVYWGEGTQDEMCYGFITIFPAPKSFDFCSQFDDVAVCSVPQFDLFGQNNCSFTDFNILMGPIATHCVYGNCSKVCKALMQGLGATGCIGNSMWKFIKQFAGPFWPNLKNIIPLLDNCWQAVLDDVITTTTTPIGSSSPVGCNNLTSSATNLAPEINFLVLILALKALF